MGGVCIPETSARGESQSNGTAEVGIRVVREFTRVFKEQIETEANMELGGEML